MTAAAYLKRILIKIQRKSFGSGLGNFPRSGQDSHLKLKNPGLSDSELNPPLAVSPLKSEKIRAIHFLKPKTKTSECELSYPIYEKIN